MTFRKVQLAAAATAALLGIAASGAAWAQTASPPAAPAAPTGPTIAWNFGAATDYVFRGFSQTKEKAQAFAGVDVAYNMFYAGAWTSNVNFAPFGDRKTTQEVDLYAGVKPVVGPLNLDLGVIYYGYIHQPKPHSVDYWEGYAKASHAFGPATLGAAIYYSPEFTGKTGDAIYYEGNLAYTINPKFSVSGAIGRQTVDLAADYTTWNAGVSYMPVANVTFDLRYYDTDVKGTDEAKGRVVAALKATF